MTPCIVDFAKTIESTGADPASLIWFDVSTVIRTEIEESEGNLKDGFKRVANGLHITETLDQPPPFPICAFAGAHLVEGHTVSVLVMVSGEDPRKGNVTISGVRKIALAGASNYAPVPALQYWIDEEGALNTAPVDTPTPQENIPESEVKAILILLKDIYKHLSAKTAPLECYRAVAKPGFINQQRRKKKKPLMYDWTTVTIQAFKPRSEPRGGTHASPRHHERRGHFRMTPSGKQVWVRNHKVGNPANGTVFHDYIIKGEAHV